jgi:hypothetical protein
MILQFGTPVDWHRMCGALRLIRTQDVLCVTTGELLWLLARLMKGCSYCDTAFLQ